MFSQGPSTNRERQTLLLLRKALPEYEINPHMRLANVVKGKVPYTGVLGQYELDFVVQYPATGEIICAIELDDSTHDMEDGRRRDANKNRWMAQAKIKLVRIRMPEEAINIRERIANTGVPEYEFIQSVKSTQNSEFDRKSVRVIMRAAATVAFAIVGYYTISKVVTSIPEMNVTTIQQQIIHQNAARQNELLLQQRRKIEQAEMTPKVAAQPAHYERVLIEGKSARECSNSNVLNNRTLECMKDHYETVWVNGAPN